jgi:hypothetical protein
VTLLIAVNAPVLLSLAMLVPLYLKIKSVPLCTIEKFAETKLVAFVAVVAVVAVVADVAVAELPVQDPELPVVFWLSVGNVQLAKLPDEGVPSAPPGAT